jgi:hypothetical protein
MKEALDWLWPLVEAPQPVVPAHVLASWPAGVHERLVDLGFLTRTTDADRVLCPECQGHIEEVIACDGPDGRARYFVLCEEVVRAEVPPEARRRWQVNLDAVASALATALGLTGRCLELLPQRLWRLGATKWQATPRDVLLVRGLHWPDARAVAAEIGKRRKPIVFVPRVKPPDDLWQRCRPPVVLLSQIATLSDTAIDIEPLEIVAAIQDAETQAASELTVVSQEKLKRMIRQQVKAEGKTTLTDDIFVAAYRQHGSLRKAAAFLSQETGQNVSKDQVHRAVQRAGGATAVFNAQSSASIRRGVASQRCDNFEKSQGRAKPPARQ